MASCLILFSVLALSISGSLADPCPFSGDCQCQKDWFDPPNIFRQVSCDANSGIPVFTGDHQYTVKTTLVLKGKVSKIPARAFTAFKSIQQISLLQSSETQVVKAELDNEAFSDTFIQRLETVNLAGVIPLPQAIKKLGKSGLQVLKVVTSGESINLDANFLPDFKHLSSLQIVSTPIAKIDDAAFSGLESSLRGLTLKSASLTKLPRNAIKGLVNLEALDLTGNKMDDFQAGDFAPYKKLVRLALSGGKLQVAVDSGSLNNLAESATMVELNDGGLKAIPAQVLVTNPQLTQISMKNNDIMAVEDGDFKNNLNLVYIYLDENPIKTVAAGSLKILKKLEILSLKSTQLDSFDLSICNDMNRVTLDLSGVVTLKAVDASKMDKPAYEHGISLLYLTGTSIEKLDTKLDDKIDTPYFNILFLQNIKNFACDQDAHWMAKHALCESPRLVIDGTICAQSGKTLEAYLKENVQNPCQARFTHPKMVRKA